MGSTQSRSVCDVVLDCVGLGSSKPAPPIATQETYSSGNNNNNDQTATSAIGASNADSNESTPLLHATDASFQRDALAAKVSRAQAEVRSIQQADDTMSAATAASTQELIDKVSTASVVVPPSVDTIKHVADVSDARAVADDATTTTLPAVPDTSAVSDSPVVEPNNEEERIPVSMMTAAAASAATASADVSDPEIEVDEEEKAPFVESKETTTAVASTKSVNLEEKSALKADEGKTQTQEQVATTVAVESPAVVPEASSGASAATETGNSNANKNKKKRNKRNKKKKNKNGGGGTGSAGASTAP
jgi:hypothetical protein